MVATCNGWEDMREVEREVLDRWEETMGEVLSALMSTQEVITRARRARSQQTGA